MTVYIFGLGLGVVIILSIWIIAVFIFFISLKLETNAGNLALSFAAITTIILVSLPQAPKLPVVEVEKPYDSLFLWRVVILLTVTVSSIIGLLSYYNFKLTDSAKPKRIHNWTF